MKLREQKIFWKFENKSNKKFKVKEKENKKIEWIRHTHGTHLAKTYLGAAGCGYCVYASSGDAAVLACSESVIGIVGIIVGGA